MIGKLLIQAGAMLALMLITPAAAAENTELSMPPTDMHWGNAPDFALQTFAGEELLLSKFAAGRPVVLNFWAEWCPPCVAEMPLLQEAWQDYGEDVQFLTLNLEKGRMDPQAFLEQRGIALPGGLAENEVGMQYGISGIPATFFISSEGNVLGMKTGAFVDGELPYILDAMLDYEHSLQVTD
ncbi:MAG: TlpA disulfide reductase family protein [bacterium]